MKTKTLIQFTCPETGRNNLVELGNGKFHSQTLAGELYEFNCPHCNVKKHRVEVEKPINQIVFPNPHTTTFKHI